MEHKLPIEIKAKWLEALRSGKYTQSKGNLWRTEKVTETDIVGHCCLGVLCDIINPTNWINAKNESGSMAWGYEGSTGTPYHADLPEEVQLVLRQSSGPDDHDVEVLLIWKNDGFNMRQHSFEEIALWIEENL